MKISTPVRVSAIISFKHIGFFALFLFFIIGGVVGQNLGFESLPSANGWTVSPLTDVTNTHSSTSPRSGIRRLGSIVASGSERTVAIGTTIGYTVTIPGSLINYIHVIGYAVGDVSDQVRLVAISTDGLSTISGALTNSGVGTYARITASGIAVNGKTYRPQINVDGNYSSGGDLYGFDDVIIYTSTQAAVDLTKPNAPTGLSTGINGSNVQLSWTAGTDVATNTSGIDGVLILRSNGLDNAAPSVLDQAYYSTTSSIGPSTIVSGGVTWTVVTNLSPSSPFTDAGSSSSSSYTYAIFMRDKAYNYSAAAVINYDACTVTPSITTTLAATSISATGASSGGQTLSAGTGCAISAKGVCWNITGTPTVDDTKTNDGSGPTDFVSSLTSLQPQTLYHVRAYATNQRGTSYGNEITFRTLSPELTAHPASFAALASCSNITLRFSALNTITNAYGYLILQRIGAAPTGLPSDATAYSVGGTIGDGTIIAIVTNQTALTQVLNSVSPSTQYFYSIIPFSYDGTNAATYNYYTTATIKTSNTSLCNAYYINDAFTAADVYTSVSGNNTLDGRSPSTPKATLTNLLATYKLQGGDTVYIDNGNYTESFVIDGKNANTNLIDEGSLITASPFAANYLVFKGAGSAKTIFTTSSQTYNVFVDRAKYVWFEGISFINTKADAGTQNILREYGESGVVKNCSLVVTNASANASYNIFLRCNKRSSLDTKRSLITTNSISNNNPSGIGIYVLGDVDFSRFERNTITMTGSNGRGMLFNHDGGADEDLNGTAQYWPISDTIFANTIICNGNGIQCNSPEGYEFYDYLIEANSITVNNSSNSTQSCVWLDNCGIDSDDDFKILRNRFRGAFAGVYISAEGKYITIANNYFCTRFGLYSQTYDGLDWENAFIHNSVYTTASCLYFGNESQDDWDIRNNILYTTATTPSACINIASFLDDGDRVENTNGNLFFAPNGAFIGTKGATGYATLASWQDSPADINSNGLNDLNSVAGIAPNFNNLANCSLDLKPDNTNWGAGYPNNGQTIPGTSITLGGGINTVSGDIKGVFTRSGWTIGAFDAASQGILPVQLLSFNARLNAQRVLLDWQTASEVNSDYFDVEKSKDGVSGWSFVSRVQSRGNSSVRADYTYIDHKPYGGESYYRLKQVDQDGRVAYSQTRKIINESKTISVYPNPASNFAIVEGLDKNRSNMIHLLDVTGKLISEHFIKDSQYRFNLSKLQPGVYHVVVNGCEHFQLVKK